MTGACRRNKRPWKKVLPRLAGGFCRLHEAGQCGEGDQWRSVRPSEFLKNNNLIDLPGQKLGLFGLSARSTVFPILSTHRASNWTGAKHGYVLRLRRGSFLPPGRFGRSPSYMTGRRSSSWPILLIATFELDHVGIPSSTRRRLADVYVQKDSPEPAKKQTGCRHRMPLLLHPCASTYHSPPCTRADGISRLQR